MSNNKEDMPRITVGVTPERLAELKEIAARQERSLQYVVGQMIEAQVEKLKVREVSPWK